jgi:bifunctional polynucleotide phosphatase/kinase
MNYELFASTQPPSASNIGLYLIDIDGTMITSKSGRRWAADAEDWTWLGDVPATLRRLAEEGWTVALISNQSDWKVSPGPSAKIASILTALEAVNGWKPWTLVATATRKEKDTVYRKPARGLYDVLLAAFPKESRKPARVRMCGDAVGPADPFPPYRWADSDAAFAAAIGAEFVRPCELFEPCEPPRAHPGGQELVILMGNPGSGKSTTGRRLAAAGYVHIEQDVMGTKAAVKKVVLAALATGASVVVDATHGSAANREPYLTLAVPVRILWHIRDGRPFNALREKPVPEVAYAVYSKHFAVPEIAEIVY